MSWRACFFVFLVGCGPSETATPDNETVNPDLGSASRDLSSRTERLPDGAVAVVFSDVEPYITQVCTQCHSDANSGQLVNFQGLTRAFLLSTMSACDRPLITPGDPSASEIWLKGANDPNKCGKDAMPPPDNRPWRTASPATFSQLEQWILHGAN